jgi:hypothetical protein
VTGKPSQRLVPIPPTLLSLCSPSSLSSSISFLSSSHSDDLSLIEFAPFIQQPPSLSSTPNMFLSVIFNVIISLQLSLI